MTGGEPVGSTGGGRRAPIMQPDARPPGDSHFCDVAGSTVYSSRADCPHTDHGDGEGDDD